MVSKHSCSRDFNHDTYFDIVCNGNTFSNQFSFFFFKNTFSSTELIQQSNHWEHDTQFTVNRCTKQGTQLCTEHLVTSFRDRNTQSTVTQEWVHFFRKIEVREFFIPTDIHCTNDNRFTVHTFKNCFVCFILVIFSWEVLRIHIQEFRTIKTNCFCTVIIYTFNVFRCTDVSSQFEMFSISSNCLSIFKESPFSFLFSVSFTSCFKLSNLLFSWVDNNFTSNT